jgi:DNA (cytosine-5)-methyltransferase 1
MKNNTITGISLFSGAVDGLAIAAQAAGIKVTHHVEWDAWCCRVLRMNHPGSVVINADIHDVKGLSYADVIMGGSPCQDFSIAGDRAGFEGKRYLWPQMRRIVGECRPRVVIHENVRGGVSVGLLDKICSDLESDGYEVWPLVYPAAIYGAPHERYRMFHIGIMGDTSSEGLQGRNGSQSALNERSRSGHILGDGFSGGQTGSKNQLESGAGTDDSRSQEIGRSYSTEIERTSLLPSGEGFSRQDRPISQPGMDGVVNGTSSRLSRLDAITDFPGFPAGQGKYQHPYEPTRTTAKKGVYYKERIQALGNAVVWQQAAPIMRTVVRWLAEVKQAEQAA